MSMSTHIIGFAPPDENWRKHKEVWDACKRAGVPVPEKTEKFFNWETPDPTGVQVDLDVREWSDEGSQGFEIDVSSIPKHIKVIRFYNSW